jgi:hypothetical protein
MCPEPTSKQQVPTILQLYTVHCRNICLKKSPMQKDKEQEGERESIQQLLAMPQDCNVPQGENYTLFK